MRFLVMQQIKNDKKEMTCKEYLCVAKSYVSRFKKESIENFH